MKRALISVFDKTGIVEFAKSLDSMGWEIISTGGTSKKLKEEGIKVQDISDLTKFPECFDGRVKTLHPNVEGGILAIRDNEKHRKQMAELGVEPIDIVVCNLYPFKQTILKEGVSHAEIIENIDIGGPTMIRAAAKNYKFVTVITDPEDYRLVIDELKNNGDTTAETKEMLAAKVFIHTAHYDALIAGYFSERLNIKYPKTLTLTYEKKQDLRYGENPHQSAAFYASVLGTQGTLTGAVQLHGKELSYNNILDTDACWSLVREFDEPAVVILKHQNPCGSAVADDVATAYDKAFACDPKSAFGGIIAANVTVSREMVEHINENKQFIEVVIAPDYEAGALELLQQKKNVRVLRTGGVDAPAALEFRSVDGGMLAQSVDRVNEDPAEFTVPTKVKPTDDQLHEMLFAWKVCKGVKSNAILVSKDHAGIGMGPGQPNRVDSAKLACERAHEACERMGVEATGLVCASDAFFPFRDNIDTLAEYGVKAIIQPGGSIRDEEVIQAADEHGIAMVFTGHRHFRH